VDGVLVMGVFRHMTERMSPANGAQWETVARRNADALVELCRHHADVRAVSGPDLAMVVEVPMEGPATLAGIPLPDSMIEALRAQARVEAVLVDDGVPVARDRARAALGVKTVRAIRLRDGKCRWPGCERRTGLQVHHLVPRSWGGTDEYANLACVCAGGGTDHHAQLVPQGPSHLVGNPNLRDGLRLERHDQHAHRDRRAQVPNTGDARAGPNAA
jgi:hypothetical protein